MAAHGHFHGQKIFMAKIFFYGWFFENWPLPRPHGNPGEKSKRARGGGPSPTSHKLA